MIVGLNPLLVGLPIVYAVSLLNVFQCSASLSSDVQNKMSSVDRIMWHINLKPEPAHSSPNRPSPDWPNYGIITFDQVTVRYYDQAPYALRNLSCCIRAWEKVGVVGRHNAGKTTFINCITRLVDPIGGVIRIDGIDIGEVGLHDVRQRITVIPEDPILFSGTLRQNLDPYFAYTDAQIWKCLEQVCGPFL